jgi:hypothetical protein
MRRVQLWWKAYRMHRNAHTDFRRRFPNAPKTGRLRAMWALWRNVRDWPDIYARITQWP